MSPLADDPNFANLMTTFTNPLLGVAIGTMVTAVIQSSAASVGILQAMSLTGAISYAMAIPIIMGQNIGTCATALISSIGVNNNAKRVAVIHVLFNLSGATIFLILFYVGNALFNLPFMAEKINPVGIAIAHTVFNVVTTLMLLPFSQLLEKIATSGHSRFPVYSESIDNVTGILYVKDILKAFSRKESVDLQKITKKAYFVPESKKIDSLLREFKRRHQHIAIAIDEYGGISGIVCMEDIIEEIVGDIQDEFDNEKEDIVSLGENVWLCDARVDLDDLNETLSSSFPTEDFDTLGGFVLDLFGRIPVKYEKIEYENFDFIVQDMEGHRVNLIKVIKKQVETTDN